MANPEHIAKLKEGVKAWNTWREENPDIRPDFYEANLTGMDLSNFHFSGADFTVANLTETNLSEANLCNANLNGATLKGVKLRAVDLSGAKLTGVNLSDGNLIGTNLTGTNFTGASLNKVDMTLAALFFTTFANTFLGQVKGLEHVRHVGPSTIDHRTILRSGKLPEVFLRGCGLPEPYIENLPALIGAVDPIQFYSCFISYSHKDEDFAKRLYADLQAKGVRCWFAPHNLKTGDKVRPTIDEAIRIYDKLLLILSEESVHSDWVEDEVESAIEQEAARKKRDGVDETVLFPIRLDDTVMKLDSGWPAAIKRKRHIGDFTQWKDHDSYTKAFERLLEDLKASGEGGRASTGSA